jgi:hypothetical protein
MVAFRAGADGAKFLVGNIPAFPAINNVIPHSYDCSSKGLDLLDVPLQQMQCHSQGCFPADTRQFCQFVDRLFQEFRGIGLQVK